MEGLQGNNSVEKLQQELAFRAKYYFKGFGSYLQGLLADLDNLTEIERTPKDEEHAREMLGKMVNLYESIPFEQIADHPDFDLLFSIKEDITKLSVATEAILNGKNDINESLNLINEISRKGMGYRERLRNILKQINQQPGHENDGFEITDLHGKIWKYPF